MSDRVPDRPRDAGRAPRAGASPASEIDAFLRRAADAPRPGAGRLIFALDATMSRQPTWDLACRLQGAMFDAAASVGGLSVQLVYFRGLGECAASTWAGDAARLGAMMARIDCRGGHTQIGKVLAHARREAEAAPVAALVYVGDAMEEDADALCAKAGELALLGVRAFLFHEGRDAVAGACFREIARLTGGVCLPFDARAAAELRALLAAVGAWAAGGRKALAARGDAASARLLADLR
jgi:hypothetical protein